MDNNIYRDITLLLVGAIFGAVVTEIFSWLRTRQQTTQLQNALEAEVESNLRSLTMLEQLGDNIDADGLRQQPIFTTTIWDGHKAQVSASLNSTTAYFFSLFYQSLAIVINDPSPKNLEWTKGHAISALSMLDFDRSTPLRYRLTSWIPLRKKQPFYILEAQRMHEEAENRLQKDKTQNTQ